MPCKFLARFFPVEVFPPLGFFPDLFSMFFSTFFQTFFSTCRSFMRRSAFNIPGQVVAITGLRTFLVTEYFLDMICK